MPNLASKHEMEANVKFSTQNSTTFEQKFCAKCQMLA